MSLALYIELTAAGLVLILFILSLAIAKFMMTGKRKTLEEAYTRQTDRYDTTYYDVLKKTDYTVKGYRDYELHVQFVENSTPTDRYIILTHGYTDNRFGTLKYAWMYLEMGFHCIIYDLRGHGMNMPTNTTYSFYESQDLYALIKDTEGRYPDMKVLGLHGESLGAATSLAVLRYHPKVDFVVEDCGFSSFRKVLRGISKIPRIFISLGNVGMTMRYGVSTKRMCPIDALVGNRVPILFMHGQKDELISPTHAEEMYAVTEGPKDIHFFPEGTHAHSVLTAQQEYKGYVQKFLTENNIIEIKE